MKEIDKVLKSIKGDDLKPIKEQLKDLLTSAEQDTDTVIKETGQKVTKWLLMRSQGEFSDDELEALLYSRDQLIRQYKNTLEIQARARVEKIAVELINFVLDNILGVLYTI